jgi:cation diffusion facilitator family transporter
MESKMETIRPENKLLKVSLYSAVLFAALGIVLGMMTNSQTIMFDGMYSVISVALSGVSLLTSKFKNKIDIKQYPFGKEVVEPLVIMLKYGIIILLVLASLGSAVFSLFNGGRQIAMDTALIYAIVSTGGCFAVYRYISRHSSKNGSNLLSAESAQWLMDTLVSAGVLLGFIIAYGARKTELLSFMLPYIDPLMVIIVSVYFIKVPICQIRKSLKEVLDMSPEDQIKNRVEELVKDVEIKYGIEETFLRVSKVSSTLWIEIDFVVDESSSIETVKDQDDIREEIDLKMKKLNYDKWLTVCFTNDRKWAI